MALFKTEPSELDWPQVYKTEPSELDWLQVYDMTRKIILRTGASLLHSMF